MSLQLYTELCVKEHRHHYALCYKNTGIILKTRHIKKHYLNDLPVGFVWTLLLRKKLLLWGVGLHGAEYSSS